MNRHLHTRRRARALKNDIKSVRLLKVLQRSHDALLRRRELLVRRRVLAQVLGRGGETVRGVREPGGVREGEALGVDVEGDDARCAAGAGEGAGEEADGTDAEDEDGFGSGGGWGWGGGGGGEAYAAGG